MFASLHKWVIALILGLSFTPATYAQYDYYVMFLATEGRPNVAQLSHTSAVFVKAPSDMRKNPQSSRLEGHTISWMPASLNIVILRRQPEPGVNLTLHQTLELATSQNAVISAWGPYRISKELYDLSVAKRWELNSGTVAYKVMDARFRPGIASNCMHAVSDIVPGPLLNTGTAFGASGTRLVMMHLAPWFVEPNTTHRWLTTPLGLDGYTIDYHEEIFLPSQRTGILPAREER